LLLLLLLLLRLLLRLHLLLLFVALKGRGFNRAAAPSTRLKKSTSAAKPR
jgi:hypothetical protein